VVAVVSPREVATPSNAAGCERVFEGSMSGTVPIAHSLPPHWRFAREGDVLVVARLDRCASFWPPISVTYRPVQKSPSLTVAESWLPTMVSNVMLTVSRTMCFQRHPGDQGYDHPVQADHPDRLVVGVVGLGNHIITGSCVRMLAGAEQNGASRTEKHRSPVRGRHKALFCWLTANQSEPPVSWPTIWTSGPI
jgi:hypothetical protein